MTDKVTIPALLQMKRDGRKSVGVVAWDYQIARIADRARDNEMPRAFDHATDNRSCDDRVVDDQHARGWGGEPTGFGFSQKRGVRHRRSP